MFHNKNQQLTGKKQHLEKSSTHRTKKQYTHKNNNGCLSNKHKYKSEQLKKRFQKKSEQHYANTHKTQTRFWFFKKI